MIITGHKGYIGSALHRMFPDAVGLDKLTGHDLRYCSLGMVWDHDVVVHLAGQASVMESVDDPFEDFTSNVLGTLRLLQACKPGTHFVFASSHAVVGDGEGPLSPYGIGKLCCEKYIDYFKDLRRTIFRFGPVIFSPKGIHTAFMKAKDAGQPATIYGDGTSQRRYCTLGHAVWEIMDAIKLDGPSMTVTVGQHQWTPIEIAKELGVEYVFAPERRYEAKKAAT